VAGGLDLEKFGFALEATHKKQGRRKRVQSFGKSQDKMPSKQEKVKSLGCKGEGGGGKTGGGSRSAGGGGARPRKASSSHQSPCFPLKAQRERERERARGDTRELRHEKSPIAETMAIVDDLKSHFL
jgi:hypothetical protein